MGLNINRTIKKIAVLGSGIMGSRIACHFANIGVDVLLLDILNKGLNADEKQNNPSQRNTNIDANLQKTLQTKPLPAYLKAFSKRITVGNFDDDLHKIATCDWVLEAVIENLAIKKELFKAVEKYRKKGTLITTNTSSIPINLMLTGLSEDFKAHFCGTHFFNPPRYLPLLEIIPTTFTKPNIVDFLVQFGENFLGKNVVLCKNTPAFIANRIGVFSILDIWHTADEMNLNIAEVDAISGVLWGRPKSATYRLCDVVGLDTLVKIATYLQKNLEYDESITTFIPPKHIKKMLESNLLGDKTNQGFYKKTNTNDGKTQIVTLNLKTFAYEEQKQFEWDDLQDLKKIENLEQRLKAFYKTDGKAGNFFRTTFAHLFAYCANRIPEITDDLYQIDDAMRAGFGWQLGPFEIWDIVSLNTGINMVKQNGKNLAPWVLQMQKGQNHTFYKTIDGINHFYCQTNNTYKIIPNREKIIVLDNLRCTQTVYKNAATTLINLGDGIVNLEFNTKLNSIDTDVLKGIIDAINLAETQYKGLIIANQGTNFSVGANLNSILKMAQKQDWDGLNAFIKLFQDTTMRIKYANIPVVVATQGLVLGGACELCLHASFVQLSAETYMGLVECGVGLLPAGGGCKEFSKLAENNYNNQFNQLNELKKRFLTIASSKVSTSALEAVEMGFLREGNYAVSLNKNTLIFDAKQKALQLSKTYSPPLVFSIKVLGNAALASFYVHATNQKVAGFISDYDEIIAKKLAYVLCGGNLSEPALVTEQYLLDLEREAFLSLCADEITQSIMAKIVSKPIN